MYCKVIQNKLLCKFGRKKMWIIYELYNFDTTFSIKKKRDVCLLSVVAIACSIIWLSLCMVREMQRCDTAHILIRMCFRHNTICVLREKSIEILAKALYFLFEFLVPFFHRHLFCWLLHMFFLKFVLSKNCVAHAWAVTQIDVCFFLHKMIFTCVNDGGFVFLEIWSCFLRGIHLRRQKWKRIMRKIRKMERKRDSHLERFKNKIQIMTTHCNLTFMK